MALYPVTEPTFQLRLNKWKYLGIRSTMDLQGALDTARAEIEVMVPDAADGTLNTSMDRAAATLMSDMALYYLRLELERDDEGSPPKALVILEALNRRRLEKLSQYTSLNGGDFSVEAFEALDEVTLPV